MSYKAILLIWFSIWLAAGIGGFALGGVLSERANRHQSETHTEAHFDLLEDQLQKLSDRIAALEEKK